MNFYFEFRNFVPGIITMLLLVFNHGSASGARHLERILGHSDRVTQVALSPDASLAVTASWDSSVVVWRTQPTRELRRFTNHRGHVNTVAYSSKGDLLASGSDDGSLFIVNALTGEIRISLQHSESVECISFDPTGSMLLVTYIDGRIVLLSIDGQLEQVEEASHGSFGSRLRCGFSSDNSIFWVSGRDSSQRWTTSTRKPLDILHNPGEGIGQTILNASGDVSIATGNDHLEMRPLNHIAAPVRFEMKSMYATALASSPDGTRVAVATHNKILILDQTGRLLRELLGDSSNTHGMQFSKDSRKLLTGNWDRMAVLWDVESGERLAVMGASSIVPRLTIVSGDLLIFNPTSSLPFQGHVSRAVLLDPIRRRSMLSDWNIVTVSKDRQWAIAAKRVSAKRRFMLFRFQDFLNEKGPLFREVGADSRWGVPTELVSFSEKQPILAVASERAVDIFDLKTGTSSQRFKFEFDVTSVALSSDGGTLLVGLSEGALSIIDLNGKQDRFEATAFEPRGGHHAPPWISSIGVSPDGRWAIVTSSGNGSGLVLDVSRRKIIERWRGSGWGSTQFSFSPDGRTLIHGDAGRLVIWNLEDKPVVRYMSDSGFERWSAMAFSQDSRQFAVSAESGDVHLVTRDTLESISLRAHSGRLDKIFFQDSRKKIWTVGEDGTVRIWSQEAGKLDATIFIYPTGRWSAAAPTGQFDSNQLESDAQDAYWISDDAPNDAMPLEIFTRGYFTAGLLQKILDGELFEKTAPPEGLNRTQPIVTIESVVPSSDPSIVTVNVAVQATERPSGELNQLLGAVYDLRLFRNGQLVAQYPDNDGLFAGSISPDELERFRKSTLVLESGRISIPFKNIQFDGQATFTAYAFNSDRVKTSTHAVNHSATVRSKPRKAYVITVGVDANESRWDLSFASNSARTVESLLRKKLEIQKYEVVTVSLRAELTSEGRIAKATATKDNIRAVMARLAGRGKGVDIDQNISRQFSKLERAHPNDVVVLYVASHGYVDPAGHFFMVPFNTGRHYDVTPDTLNACLLDRSLRKCESSLDFLARSISSSDLAIMWKHIDSAEKYLILDACHSAAAQGPSFRPGPLGDASFGQVAFDKRITVLSATQPDKTARATALTRRGNSFLVDVLDSADNLRAEPLTRWFRRAERIAPLRSAAIYPDLPIPERQRPVLLDLGETSTGFMLLGNIRGLESEPTVVMTLVPQ